MHFTLPARPCFSAACRIIILISISLGSSYADEPSGEPIQMEAYSVTGSADSDSLQAPASRSGTKSDTPFLDVPQTVDVVGRNVFSLEGARSLEDVLSNVAGVSPSVGDGQRDQVYIRGFVATYDEYVDGVRDSEMYFRDLSNIEQVEVLKGPSAALYGRGSSGGLINRITRKPSDTPSGDISVTAGSWGDGRSEIDATGPLGSSPLTYRFDGAAETSGGFRDEYFLQRLHLSPSLAWTPSRDARLLVQLDGLTDRRLDDLGVPALVGMPGSGFPGTAPDVPISAYYGSPDGRQADYVLAQVFSATATYDQAIAHDLSLHAVTRVEHYALDRNNVLPTGVFLPEGGVFDGDLSDVWVARSDRHILRHENDLFEQLEVSWEGAAAGVAHRVLLGTELARQTANTNSLQYADAPVSLVDPVLTRRPADEAPSSHTFNAVAASTCGIYLQDQVTLAAQWKLLVGARADYFSVDQNGRIAPYTALSNTSRKASPRVGLVWEASRHFSVYASASRSFQPAADGLSIAVTSAALAPQETQSVEVGVKASLASDRLTATASVFDLERDISETNPLSGALTNAGLQRSRGIEVSTSGRLSRAWNVTAAYTLLGARIVDGGLDAAGVDLNGRRPGLVPRSGASLFTTYALTGRFGIGAGAEAMGQRFTSNDDFVSIPGYATFAALAYFRAGRWEARLRLDNLADKRYIDTAGEGTDATGQTVMPGAPRHVSATVMLRF